MMYVQLLFITVGWVIALARFTRLMTVDEITDFIRIYVYNRWGEDSMPGVLSRCPWCQSVWYASATSWVVIIPTGISWWWYPVIALMGSELVGLIASQLEPDDDAEVEIIN